MHFSYLIVTLESLVGGVDDNGYQQDGQNEVKDTFYFESKSFLLVLRHNGYLVSLVDIS